MNVEIEVEHWSENRQAWTFYKTMAIPVFTSVAAHEEFRMEPVNVVGGEALMTRLPGESRAFVALACQAFTTMVSHGTGEAGYYRLGLDTILEWRDGAVRWRDGGGPRDLECKGCEISVETTCQGDGAPCPECGDELSDEGA